MWAGIGAYRLHDGADARSTSRRPIGSAPRASSSSRTTPSSRRPTPPGPSRIGRAAFGAGPTFGSPAKAGRYIQCWTPRCRSPRSTTSVIGAYLLAITAFGSWFARYQKTTRDYFLTERSVPWWAICFTVVATETSTLTFIGIPATAYAGNMTFLQLALGYVIGRMLVSVLFIPAYFRGELFTSYELLQRRFGTRVKTLAAVIFLITRSLADGIRLFTTAL